MNKKGVVCMASMLMGIFASSAMANEGVSTQLGMDLHEESCVECHIVNHDQDFYENKDRKMDEYSKLKRQVSMCMTNFNLDWFPEEERSVLKYLNDTFYKYEIKENE